MKSKSLTARPFFRGLSGASSRGLGDACLRLVEVVAAEAWVVAMSLGGVAMVFVEVAAMVFSVDVVLTLSEETAGILSEDIVTMSLERDVATML